MATEKPRMANSEWRVEDNSIPVRHSPRATRPDLIARTWLGTPYIHQASVKGAGCDCLGLLRGVLREIHGEDAETPPPYSPDWAEATGEETLYKALARHLPEIPPADLSAGDIALFRMAPHGPAKHCGIIALKQRSDSAAQGSPSLIHARQNRCVCEEPLTPYWRRRLVHAFRLAPRAAILSAGMR